MYNFKEIEDSVIKFWKEEKIPERVRKASQKNKKKYYFMDGPPYATGSIHMGTALNKILKDIAVRSQRMQGKNVFDRPGYDTHGIPIEFKVEKQIGVNSKQDIENYGVKKFIEKCREFATKHIDVMNSEFENLGVWMDWKNAYLTLDNKYIESIWWTFKKADEKNLLYLGKYPVHVCPRCETAVAYNEIVYGKQEDMSIYVKFPLKNEKNKFLIIWTTTPWTLPGNTAVMVHPDYEYIEAQISNGEIWIVAKNLSKKLFSELKLNFKIKKSFKGRELEGKEYINPLSKHLNLNKLKNSYKIILSGRYVTLETGTGLVHCAPGHGKEDYDASRNYNIDIISPVEINGKLTKETGKYAGEKARIIDEEIINDLENDGFVVYKHIYSHDYPLCWRCSSPLLMISVPQWFFKISSIHKKLLNENNSVNWVPSWAKDRMKAWLEGISDWPISRQRYWGTPLPIWICDECGNRKVVESILELEKLSRQEIKDLHKPDIDDVKWQCKKCNKGTMKRVPEVLDVWFDSGVSSWAALDFPQKQDLMKKYWPADFNLEGSDQFRGWWNSQLILSVIAFDKKPYETIYVHGLILDLGKKKMSKSLGNVISPLDVIEKYGRDAMRFYFSLINPGDNISFDESYFREINKFSTILINIKNLVENEHKLEFKDSCSIKKIEDKWVISRLNSLIKEINDNYNKYLFYKNSELISKFIIEDVSRTYIRIIRERIIEKDKIVFDILNKILSSILVLLAPITPYLTESIYQKMIGKKTSIHLLNFPKFDNKKIDKKLENQFNNVLKIIETGLSQRDISKIGLKWPLAKAIIYIKNRQSVKNLEEIIKSQLNVKKIELKKSKDELKVELDTILTPKLEAEGFAREISRKVQALRKNAGLEKKNVIKLHINTEKYILDMLESHKKFIKNRTGARIILFNDGKIEKYKNKEKFDIKGKGVLIGFDKIK